MLLDQLASLHAQVALGDDVVPIATNGDRRAVAHVDLDAAHGVAEAAEGLVGLDHVPRLDV
jgi:hypothetical protein